MTKGQLIRRLKEVLDEERKLPPGVGFQWMVDNGLIRPNGEVIMDIEEQDAARRAAEQRRRGPA